LQISDHDISYTDKAGEGIAYHMEGPMVFGKDVLEVMVCDEDNDCYEQCSERDVEWPEGSFFRDRGVEKECVWDADEDRSVCVFRSYDSSGDKCDHSTYDGRYEGDHSGLTHPDFENLTADWCYGYERRAYCFDQQEEEYFHPKIDMTTEGNLGGYFRSMEMEMETREEEVSKER